MYFRPENQPDLTHFLILRTLNQIETSFTKLYEELLIPGLWSPTSYRSDRKTPSRSCSTCSSSSSSRSRRGTSNRTWISECLLVPNDDGSDGYVTSDVPIEDWTPPTTKAKKGKNQSAKWKNTWAKGCF